jgi:hypothetical protein
MVMHSQKSLAEVYHWLEQRCLDGFVDGGPVFMEIQVRRLWSLLQTPLQGHLGCGLPDVSLGTTHPLGGCPPGDSDGHFAGNDAGLVGETICNERNV